TVHAVWLLEGSRDSKTQTPGVAQPSGSRRIPADAVRTPSDFGPRSSRLRPRAPALWPPSSALPPLASGLFAPDGAARVVCALRSRSLGAPFRADRVA